MTSEDVKSELDKEPFRPMRLHLVSGKTFDITRPHSAFMLQNAVTVLQPRPAGGGESGYDLLSLRNIERIERPDGRNRLRGPQKG